jgi:hypothetical protein
MESLLKVERDVYSAQGFNSWGVLQVGMTLFRIFNGTRKPFVWRLELLTPSHKFRFCRGYKK